MSGSASPSRSDSTRAYGAGVGILSLGLGAAGLVSYAYFSLASHALSADDYGRITLLWSTVFITVSILYRPVEQLLSRTIAEREAHGAEGAHHLRVAAGIQLVFGLLFAIAALAFRSGLEDDLFGGSSALYWILVATVLAYAASYFARGILAGRRRFALYGALTLMESALRVLFALAVAVGIASGEAVVALGMVAGPVVTLALLSFIVVRALVTPEPRVGRTPPPGAEADAPAAVGGDPDVAETPEFTLARGSGYAASVVAVMLAEQTFLNAGPLIIKATAEVGGAALAGFAFNALLIARAPLQLFQAVQTSILPHLTRLRARGDADPFVRSVNLTLLAVAAFAAGVALVMLAIGPPLMDLLFGGDFDYAREGLVLVAIGMGLYLSASTLTQAMLARGQPRRVAAPWLAAAVVFTAFLLTPFVDDRVLRVEAAFAAGAAVLAASLYFVYRRADRGGAVAPDRLRAAAGSP